LPLRDIVFRGCAAHARQRRFAPAATAAPTRHAAGTTATPRVVAAAALTAADAAWFVSSCLRCGTRVRCNGRCSFSYRSERRVLNYRAFEIFKTALTCGAPRPGTGLTTHLDDVARFLATPPALFGVRSSCSGTVVARCSTHAYAGWYAGVCWLEGTLS